MRNWMKAVAVLAVLGLAIGAVAQTQIEGYQLRVNTTGYGFLPIVDATETGGVTTWSLDSAAVDTSYSYKIVPGCKAAVFASLDAAADSLDGIYVDISADGTNWAILDSVGTVLGTAVTHTVLADAAILEMMGRYLRFRADNDDGAGAATVLTAYLVTSPTTND